jgi:hypothetical protein
VAYIWGWHHGISPITGDGAIKIRTALHLLWEVGYRWDTGCRSERPVAGGMEFSLGAGCYRLHYDKFRNESNGALVESRQKTFFGIDQVNISITYTFGRGGES